MVNFNLKWPANAGDNATSDDALDVVTEPNTVAEAIAAKAAEKAAAEKAAAQEGEKQNASI